jgi:hypothetical protein
MSEDRTEATDVPGAAALIILPLERLATQRLPYGFASIGSAQTAVRFAHPSRDYSSA